MVVGLFLMSVFLRKDVIDRELSAEKEWITAHTLITVEIWDENGGPSNFNFAPIYTYPGDGNKDIAALGGVRDNENKLYYVSYPPFAFISSYYITKIFGGPNLYSIRVLGLLIHFIAALLIYLIVKKLALDQRDRIVWSGIFASSFYLFSSGHLWIHGFLYFSDILVQVFVLGLVLVLIDPIRTKSISKKQLFTVCLLVFFGCWTEWLMMFFAFVVGLYFLFQYFKHREKICLYAFLAIGCTATFALLLTIVHYSSIGGFDQFIDVWLNKYQERSGAVVDIQGSQNLNFSNPKSYELLTTHFQDFYWMLINCATIIGVGWITLLLVSIKTKWVTFKLSYWTVIGLFFFAILLHMIVFFNFNAIHDFAKLKLGTILILIVAVLVLHIEESKNQIIKYSTLGLFSILVLTKLPIELERFKTQSEESWFAHFYKEAAVQVKNYSTPEDVVFMNIPYLQPEFIYRSKHNSYKVQSLEQAVAIMKNRKLNEAHFYEFEKVKLQRLLLLKIDGDGFSIADTLLTVDN